MHLNNPPPLHTLNHPDDLRQVPRAQLHAVADELRAYLLDTVSKTGGHLSSNLGTVELTVALHYVFNTPHDRVVWDVGHQTYPHKILTGRRDRMASLRQLGGLSGFPQRGESEFDTFGTAHSSTSISAALGMAMAAKIKGEERYSIAVIGDGALTAGMAFEALNNAGVADCNLLVILNDNDMSISPPVGALNRYLAQLMSGQFYAAAKNVGKTVLKGAPPLFELAKRIEEHAKGMVVPATLFEKFGFNYIGPIDGHDLDAVEATISAAKANNNGKPKFIKCNTIIGKGMEETEGTNAAHGEAGVPYVDKAKKNIGLPDGEKWYVSEGTRDFFAEVQKKNKATYDAWQATFAAWKEANPALATQLHDAIEDKVMPASEMIAKIPQMGEGAEATRVSGFKVIQHISSLVPHYISGSADLHGSTRNYITDGGNFGAGFDKSYSGKNLYFGIREHAMGSIMNGFAFHGLFKVSGSTFLVFVDYLRATIRVAALSELNRVSYILTHDSIGVGEDGPTHQPVETVSGLRVIPNLDVFRPGDAEETVAAMVHSVTRKEGPVALIFSRQNIVQNTDMDFMARREGALKGAYIAKKETADLDLIVLATGSEMEHALAATKDMPGARVVSMPCMELFDRQEDSYKEEVLPSSCTKRIAMEAGVTGLWYKYASKVVGTDRFGFSAPGDIVMKEFGMTAANLKKEIESMA